MLRAVLLSVFDVRIGPTLAVSVPSLNVKELQDFNVIPKLIDLVGTEGFFISTLEKVYSANYYFNIENTSTRGNKDMLLLSIAVQVSDDDDKEKILIFLKNTEDALRDYVHRIERDEQINELGILSRENSIYLNESLHGFFDVVFSNEKFDSMFKQGQDRIGIFSQLGFDPLPVVNFFRKEIQKERSPSLRTRLVMSAIDEFSYNTFHCKDRQTDTCMKENCPVCAELVRESDAAIYMFDSGSFKMDLHFEDMIDYLVSIDRSKQIPVLVIQFDGNPSTDGATIYEEITARIQGEVARLGLKIQPRHARIPLGNTDAFKECMSWLIKAII